MGGYFTIEERKTKEELFPMEIERKFWIDTLPELPEERRSDVYQGYLCTEPVELRIRKRVEAGGEMVYQLCVKSIGKLSRHEVETKLSRAQFEELASMPQGVSRLSFAGRTPAGVFHCGQRSVFLCGGGVCVRGGCHGLDAPGLLGEGNHL